jgi:peroxiredoxin
MTATTASLHEQFLAAGAEVYGISRDSLRSHENFKAKLGLPFELISDAEEHYKKGLEHFLAGDLKDAETWLTRALDVDSRFVRAHLQMGVLRKMQDRGAEALVHFERVVALDSRSDAGREAAVHVKKLKTS